MGQAGEGVLKGTRPVCMLCDGGTELQLEERDQGICLTAFPPPVPVLPSFCPFISGFTNMFVMHTQ